MNYHRADSTSKNKNRNNNVNTNINSNQSNNINNPGPPYRNQNTDNVNWGLNKKITVPLGRGSTGRTTPNNLNEKLAMEEVMSNPTTGNVLPIRMTDSRWPSSEGWVKMSKNVNGIEIHYVRNARTGQVDDFKFK
ncbi:hypothetical protein MM221_21160 [Salipaludibacillus sp. LMS25]|jgi:filamentous hemagglutinin|uniref:hypothetical protein n=1 Tax=Salipaludibacillus sp. LMS25 TaxID=2924031 RepID=UPI0020D0EFB4|nr:hypothetical protein [Salipaludibacillus sp. LMS25]UTR15005.1 hypothetical protein MM221_21160 [Salipaludibacillus sp. LMS25]